MEAGGVGVVDTAVVIAAIGSMGALVSTIVGFMAQAKREARHRQWDIEDRAYARRQAQEQAELTALKLAAHTEIAANDVKDAIAENTRLTLEVGEKADRAYTEANNVNEKILSVGLGRRHLDRDGGHD